MGSTELNTIKILIEKPFVLLGDVLIRMVHNGRFKDIMMFRFAFNTAFIPEDNVLKLSLKDLDPDKVSKDPKFPEGF